MNPLPLEECVRFAVLGQELARALRDVEAIPGNVLDTPEYARWRRIALEFNGIKMRNGVCP